MYCVGIMTNATENVNARENEMERVEDQRNEKENRSASENERGIDATKGPTRLIVPDTELPAAQRRHVQHTDTSKATTILKKNLIK
jgi:hypothetical protein